MALLLLGLAPKFLGADCSELLRGMDCSKSASSSPDDATESLL